MIEYTEGTKECELVDFPAWDGGQRMLERIQDYPKVIEEAERTLLVMEEEQGYPLTDEQVNDYLWFDLEEDMEVSYLYDPETDTFHNDDSWYE